VTSLALLGALVALAVVPSIEVVRAPDDNCPSTEQLQAAFESSRAAPDGTDPRPHRLLLTRTADRTLVELTDAAGQSLLSRELRLASNDCANAADAIALIVERYFRDLTWAPPPRSSASIAPPPEPAPEGPSVLRAIPAENDQAHAGDRRSPRLVLGAGPAYWTRTDGLGVAVTARLRVLGPLHVGIAGLVPPFHMTSALGGSGGRAETTGVPIIASIGATRAAGPWAVTANASGLATVEKGQSQSIAAPATAWRTVLAAGLGVAGTRRVTERLRIAADLAGYRAVLGRSYVVAGIPGQVLEPSPWQAVVMVNLEWIARP
jgi:hypothetical protein